MKLAELDMPSGGAALLEELRRALTAYVVFPSEEAADAVTLWITATHGQQAWEHATRLAIISPEKRCGKSRLLDVIEATSYRSLITVNISSAALVRSIGEDPPTLLLDEADTVFGPKTADNHEDLRGILNAGHQRNRPYVRWDVQLRQPEHCPTFAMAALAGIGDLPDTVMDRSVIVRMRRRAQGEHVRPYRQRRDGGPLAELGARLQKWMHEHLGDLQNAEPEMPVEDRAADTWESLVAVADLAGGPWPRRARAAALKLVRAENEADVEGSMGARLLADIRDLFSSMTVSFLPSRELVNRLRRIDEAPWGDDDLTMRKLAMKLKPYGVGPRQNAAKTDRGYHAEDFGDAFARYLPSPSVQRSEQVADQPEQADTSPDTSAAEKSPDTTAETKSPPMCPDEITGQDTSTDARTLADSPPPTGWPEDSIGAAVNS
ncbi:DUF3631 domain-containing protein [Actinomadura fibrosa]|uniref:DUF3631 domain-containing protein n=1 Tax=Actinomadura fibrosa TaxID=111802 RepID=A0ABW2XJ64_9ACTN|nr:DUF3631 domain-containing protein [Actinomadura fibrosa]